MADNPDEQKQPADQATPPQPEENEAKDSPPEADAPEEEVPALTNGTPPAPAAAQAPPETVTEGEEQAPPQNAPEQAPPGAVPPVIPQGDIVNNRRTPLHLMLNNEWGLGWIPDSAFGQFINYADPNMIKKNKRGFEITTKEGHKVAWQKANNKYPETITGPRSGFNDNDAEAMVVLAKLRGWNSLQVQGKQEYREKLWLAAMRQNLRDMEAFELGKLDGTVRPDDKLVKLEVTNFTPLQDSAVWQQWLKEKEAFEEKWQPQLTGSGGPASKFLPKPTDPAEDPAGGAGEPDRKKRFLDELHKTMETEKGQHSKIIDATIAKMPGFSKEELNEWRSSDPAFAEKVNSLSDENARLYAARIDKDLAAPKKPDAAPKTEEDLKAMERDYVDRVNRQAEQHRALEQRVNSPYAAPEEQEARRRELDERIKADQKDLQDRVKQIDTLRQELEGRKDGPAAAAPSQFLKPKTEEAAPETAAAPTEPRQKQVAKPPKLG